MEKVILYSNGCPQCRVLKYKLKEKDIQFEEISDIDLMLRKGFKSMPMLEVDKNVMTYSQALKWLDE